MTHIALLTTSYPDGTPGSEAAGGFVEDFAEALSSKARVTVVAPARQGAVNASAELTVRRFSVPRLPLSLLSPMRVSDWWPIIATLRRGQQAIDQLTQQDRPDHIFALWALPSGHWANVMLRRHGVPYSIWSLGSDIWTLGKIPLVRSRLHHVLNSAHRCYADGFALGEAVQAISGRKCEFLPSTRNITFKKIAEVRVSPPYRLAFLGRWHPNKGIDILLNALGLLSENDWQNISEVRIFGGGPLEDLVMEQTDNLKRLGGKITVGGYLDKAGASALIGWADYLVLPSRIESIPVIFSDAAKIGTPLIATPIGDLPRLFEDYRFGVLASEASSAALADAIKSALVKKPADFSDGLQRAREDFSIPEIVDRFLSESFCGHST
ncbi:MAG TPA: glycosyltransferase [Gammaproteobacteria bacterium]|nr:glycosyltransferase [Gammaproteobacteria bacterium]